MADIGELNLGQLVRERFGSDCCSIGMTTHEGEVTAAHEWDEPAALRTVRTSLPGSYERLFHDVGMPAFVFGSRRRRWRQRWPDRVWSVPLA